MRIQTGNGNNTTAKSDDDDTDQRKKKNVHIFTKQRKQVVRIIQDSSEASRPTKEKEIRSHWKQNKSGIMSFQKNNELSHIRTRSNTKQGQAESSPVADWLERQTVFLWATAGLLSHNLQAVACVLYKHLRN